MMRRKRRGQLYQGPPIPMSLVIGPDRDGTVCVVTGATSDVYAEQSTVTTDGRARTVGAMRVEQNSGGDDRMRAAVHYRDRDGRPWRRANESTEPDDVLDEHERMRQTENENERRER